MGDERQVDDVDNQNGGNGGKGRDAEYEIVVHSGGNRGIYTELFRFHIRNFFAA